MSTFTFDLSSLSSVNSSVSSLESGLLSKTPDDKLTYSGNDPIIWDRTNNERIRRGLDPLPGPRPVDDGKTYNTRGGGTTTNTGTGRPLTEEEKAKAAAIAKQLGVPDPTAMSKTFEVNGPPGMTREQAFEIFKKQADTGGLTGFSPGDVLSSQTQVADGLASARAELTQGFAGFPGTDAGALNSFKSVADTAKQSLAAGTTGNLQSKIGSAGSILQQTSGKIEGLFGTPVTNGINTADFAKTASALVPMAGLGTTDVRATMASVGAATGQDFSQFTNSAGVGKFGFDATQLESAGLLKPGTASTFLGSGTNDLTTVLSSPAVWTGKGGINNLDSLLNNPSAQNLTQQNLMSSGLASASAFGVPVNNLNPKELGGVAANFAKDSTAGVDWIKGQLPAGKQAEFDQRWKDAQFAIGSADEKFNDAMLQMAPPGEAEDTVNRETLTAAMGRVFGNDKIPPIDYNDTTPRLPGPLFAEQRVVADLYKGYRAKFDEINATEATISNVDAKIGQLSDLIKKLNELYNRTLSLKTDIEKLSQPVSTALKEVEDLLASIVAFIDDIRTLYLPALRRIKSG